MSDTDVYNKAERILADRGDYPALRATALDALRETRQALQASSAQELGEHAREIKSQADYSADAALRRVLARTNLPILSEEDADARWGHEGGLCWVVDPLDGTVNYMRGLPPSRIAIALCLGSTPLYGIIGATAEPSHTEGGIGLPISATHSSLATRQPRPLSEAIVLTGFPAGRTLAEADLGDFQHLLFSVRRVRLWGSAAASLEMVALGHADGYIERRIGFWDVAAGLALLRAAHIPFSASPLSESGRMDVIAGCVTEMFETNAQGRGLLAGRL
jgi:myo-inositol-1(or 4)-monophosphatase